MAAKSIQTATRIVRRNGNAAVRRIEAHYAEDLPLAELAKNMTTLEVWERIAGR